MNSTMIRRHARINMLMHWFNAGCWLFLLVTGLGLIRNDHLEILGGRWAAVLRSIFGGGERLLVAHEAVGVLWAVGFLVYTAVYGTRHVVPFLREILAVDLRRDTAWLVKKGIHMTIGSRVFSRLGVDPTLPDQGFYNVGQKMFAVPSIFGGAVIAATGFIMAFPGVLGVGPETVQWAIVVHFAAVTLVFAGLLIHVYMASIAAGERPAFISMFTGKVPADYARHHHRLWYEAVEAVEPAENRSR